MFELSILLLALFIVALFAYIHTIFIPLPPTAKLLCDIWNWIGTSTGGENVAE